MEGPFLEAARYLPLSLRAAALGLTEEERARCEELRFRAGRGAFWLAEGRERPLMTAEGPAKAGGEDLRRVVELCTQASFHTALDQLRDGFLPLRGGHRLGLCGTAAVRGGAVINLRELSSLALRIARPVPGVGEALLPRLRCGGGVLSTLILAPPGGGKTTLLRDLVRALSTGGGDSPPLRTALADERGEVAALWRGEPQLDVGQADVMDGCPKAAALLMLLRSMNPQVLAADEITAPEDVDALGMAANCGAAVVATAHGTGVEDLLRRPLYQRLWDRKVFRRLVTIRMEGGRRCYTVEELP